MLIEHYDFDFIKPNPNNLTYFALSVLKQQFEIAEDIKRKC